MESKARVSRAEKDRQRDAEAARLRAMRLTFDEIAERLGYADASGAWRAAQRGLQRAVREPHQDMVTLDLAELEEMAREAWAVLRAKHYTVDKGTVVHHDGKPLLDDAPVLAAIGRLLDIQARRAKLVGLDAPARSKIEVVSYDAVEAEIMRLEAEIDERARANADRRAAGESASPA